MVIWFMFRVSLLRDFKIYCTVYIHTGKSPSTTKLYTVHTSAYILRVGRGRICQKSGDEICSKLDRLMSCNPFCLPRLT